MTVDGDSDEPPNLKDNTIIQDKRQDKLTTQKMQLKRELKPMKEGFVNKKIKLELSSSNTFLIAELIQQKEAHLSDIKVKLVQIEKEVNDFIARSGDLEKELAENSGNLALMQTNRVGFLEAHSSGRWITVRQCHQNEESEEGKALPHNQIEPFKEEARPNKLRLRHR